MGFEAVFFSRLDFNEKIMRIKQRAMNFLWRPSFSHFGTSRQIFTSVFQDHYGFPDPFKADMFFKDQDLMITDKTLTSFNADEKLIEFVNFVHDYSDSRLG